MAEKSVHGSPQPKRVLGDKVHFIGDTGRAPGQRYCDGETIPITAPRGAMARLAATFTGVCVCACVCVCVCMCVCVPVHVCVACDSIQKANCLHNRF